MPTTKIARPVPTNQTSDTRIISSPIIPQLTLEMELSQEPPESFAIDRFSGSVRAFRVYLKAQLKLLEAGAIAP
ncbi:MAG: hypothetical protein WA125_16830 [Desulfosporosinus sp.]